MADDYSQKIPVIIVSAPVLLDKDSKSSNRYVLGYVSAVYDIDEDAEIVIFFRRNTSMDWESLEPIILSKDSRRFFRKLPLDIGSVIDYYVQLSGEFTNFILTSLKVSIKTIPEGKHS